MALGEAQVHIRASLDKLDGDLSKAKGLVKGAMQGMDKLGKVSLAGITAGVAALGAGISVMAGQIMTGADSLMRIERIGAQTEAVIASTGGAAGLTATQIGEMSDSLEKLTSTESESTQEAANMLLTFTGIGRDVFPMAMDAVVDMGRALDKTGEGAIDMSGQALMIGKALQDPILGMTALRRVGVNFNESAVETVQAFMDIGDIASAQKFILAELETEFGGSGEAFAATTKGTVEQMKHQWGTLQEMLAGPFVDVFSTVFGKVSEILTSPEVMDAVSGISTSVGLFFDHLEQGMPLVDSVGVLITQLGITFGLSSTEARALGDSFTSTVEGIQSFVEKVGEVVGPVAEAISSFVSWKDVLIGLGIAVLSVVIPAIVSFAGPILLMAAILIGTVALIRNAWENNWGGIRDKVAAVINFIVPLVQGAIAGIKAWWAENGEAIKAKAAEIWEGIKSAISTAIEAARSVIQSVLDRIKAFWDEHGAAITVIVTAFMDAIRGVIEDVTSFISGLWEAHGADILAGAESAWEGIKSTIESAINIVGDIIEAVAAAIQGNWEGFHEALNSASDGVWNTIKSTIETITGTIQSTIETVSTGIQGAWETAMGAIESATQPAIDIIDGILGAAQGLWDWLSGKIFDFKISLPSLPSWAIPGSPMPIHTAWKAFAQDLNRMTIKPKFDLSAAVPMMLAMEDSGAVGQVAYNSTTTINTNRDPMQVLRASRHLDRLGGIIR